MALVLELNETDGPVIVSADPRETRALRRAKNGLSVEERLDGRVSVGPRKGFVGSLSLPGGGRVVVRPKAPVGAPTALLALAYRTMAPPASIGSTDFAESTPSDWLLVQLAAEIERLLAQGLRRGYEDRRELLSVVRGRMRPLLNPARLPMVDCEFSEFTLDTPANRLLRGSLELLAGLATHKATRRKLRESLQSMAMVPFEHPTREAFGTLRLDPLATYYEPALNLCRLAIEGSGLDEAGTSSAPAFFILMWRVWESALANALRDAGLRHVREQPKFSDRVVHVTGSPSPTVSLTPDILLGPRDAPTLVIDAKWAPPLQNHYGTMRLNNAHLYQLAAYCNGLDCDGVLVYPRFDTTVDTTYVFNGRRLRVLTVDLGGADLSGLHAAAKTISDS